ncbi:transcription elongation factor Spt5 [Candidatus Woesearchaeota archaeon]|nr:transcription elongation factor Spt5 [Candidatus Woesearchaeota archaeon]
MAEIFSVRTTANREEQVVDFLAANAKKKGIEVYAVIRPHGMRSYIFIEAANRMEAETAVFEVPYARGVLPEAVPYEEIEHMVETIKKEIRIQKGDIAEIISGPFKREKCKITKVDKDKEEVVVELLEAAVPIPITLKTDALKVIRREGEEED